MSSHIRGVSELLAELEQRLGQEQVQRISDQALREAADVFVAELKQQFETFKDTGASINEITLTEPYDKSGVRTITVHWRGPRSRYRVIHLNEFGTVKNPNPRGKGAIARTMQIADRAYKQAIENAIRRSV